MDYSKILKDLRIKNGWTQMELAEKLGISHPFVSQIETGIRTPSVKMQAEINKLVSINIDSTERSDRENAAKIATLEGRIEELEKKFQKHTMLINKLFLKMSKKK